MDDRIATRLGQNPYSHEPGAKPAPPEHCASQFGNRKPSMRATGITYNTVRSIERARYATILLKEGMSILDTVDQAGYADQPHLTRSLKYFIGQTPAQIANQNRQARLSFLFKTAHAA